MAILTTAAGLTNKLAFSLNLFADCFAIGNLRLTDVCLNVKLALHAVNDNVEVKLAHAANNGLPGLFIGTDAERWIFCCQLAKRCRHLLLVGLGAGLNRNMNNRLREFHALKRDDLAGGAEGVTGRNVFQAHRRGDVAGANFFDLFTGVGVHLKDAPNALFLPLTGL